MRFLSLLFAILTWTICFFYIDQSIEYSDLEDNEEYDSFQGKNRVFFLWASGEYKYTEIDHSDKWNTSLESYLKNNGANINTIFYPIFIISLAALCGFFLKDPIEGILFGLIFGLFFIVTGYIGLGGADEATPLAEDTLIYGVGFPTLVGLLFNKFFAILFKSKAKPI